MKTSLRIISVLLALITAFGCMTIAFAKEKETNNLNVEITTDKADYKLSDKIEITIKVKNISKETLRDVQIQTSSDDLVKIKGISGADKEELSSGETIELKLTVKPFCGSEKLNTLKRLSAFINLLPNLKAVYVQYVIGWKFSALNTVNYDYGVVYSDKEIKAGDINLDFKVQASYCIGKK